MKNQNALKTIGEVSKLVSVPQYVIRFWEKKFKNLNPIQKNRGRRYYSNNDLKIIKTIKDLLYNKCYTIKGVQKYFKENKIIINKQGNNVLINELNYLNNEIQKILDDHNAT